MPSHDPYRARPPITLTPPEPITGRRPRMLGVFDRYLPGHNAGAEATAHAILNDVLSFLGWDVIVASREHRGAPYSWDRVLVGQAPPDRGMGELWQWCDVAVTHLRATRGAVAWARHGRPLVHLIHNHTQLSTERVEPRDAALVVWNSRWIAEQWSTWAGPSVVVHPPVFSDEYATANPDRFECGSVTLLNLTDVKGGGLFWRLCAARPDLPFLGVEGAYYLQEIPKITPANAQVWENQVDVRDVYEKTRVLVVPSRYESWGRVAVEAMMSGIPIIAADTPGLRESCTLDDGTPAAIFADVDDEDAWLDALAALDDRDVWQRWSRASYDRGAELIVSTMRETVELERLLRALAEGRVIS